MKYLTRKLLSEALQKAAKSSDQDYLLIQLLAKSGMRISEVAKFRTQDIIWDEEQIIVRGKGNKIRNIDIPGELVMLLRVYMTNHDLKINDRFFPLTTRALHYRVKHLANINPHAFRHTYAINLLRTTQNIRYVQKQLGHTNLQTTGIYLQFIDFSEEKSKLGELYI